MTLKERREMFLTGAEARIDDMMRGLPFDERLRVTVREWYLMGFSQGFGEGAIRVASC
jgi:hypothetical protein